MGACSCVFGTVEAQNAVFSCNTDDDVGRVALGNPVSGQQHYQMGLIMCILHTDCLYLLPVISPPLSSLCSRVQARNGGACEWLAMLGIGADRSVEMGSWQEHLKHGHGGGPLHIRAGMAGVA